MAADSNELDHDRRRSESTPRRSDSRDSSSNDRPNERGSDPHVSKSRDSKPRDSQSRDWKPRSEASGGSTDRRSKLNDSSSRSHPRDPDDRRGYSAGPQRTPRQSPRDDSDDGARLGGDLGGSFGLGGGGTTSSNKSSPRGPRRPDSDRTSRGRPESGSTYRDEDRRGGKGEDRGRREAPARRNDQDRPRRSDSPKSRSDRPGNDRQGRPERTDRYSDRTDRHSDRYSDREERPVRERPTGSRIRPEDDGHVWPVIPEWADRRDLGGAVLADLRGLSKEGAEFVADHLVAAVALVDSEPEQAWEHARAARAQGGRISVVRETVGLVAYRASKWSDAITELRAARRMAGGPGLLAVMADAQRALGKPERAIELASSPEATQLEAAAAAELTIVVSGARSDLGQGRAALVGLRSAAREVDPNASFAHRLYYAYAALLAETGDAAEALSWFIRAADADFEDETDAAERAEVLSSESSPNEPS